MAQADFLFQAFNVGQVDTNKLHRVDLAKMRLAAEVQENIIPLSDGRGLFRPGFGYLNSTKSNAFCHPIAFIAGNSEAYGLELTANILRVLDCSTDTMITRPAVTSTVTNGNFSSSVGWTLASTSGQTTQITGGKLEMRARAHGGKAAASRTMTIVETTTIHAFKIVVDRGPVMFRFGSSSGADDLIAETTLDTGYHSLAFDPNGAATGYIQFFSELPYKVIVDEITVESAGAMEVTTPWDATEITLINTVQSLDVMYVSCPTNKPMKIERRGDGDAAGLSWSVVEYKPDDGPFTPLRTSPVKLTPSATEGDITLTASSDFFKSTHVGALFKIWHTSQRIDTYLAGYDEHTPTFLVTGITETNFEERKWAVAISGTWVGTIKTRRSFDGEDIEFHDVRREQSSATIPITANATYTNDDNDDNTIAWYEYRFTAYTSGEARIIVTYEGGGGYGIARVTGFTSSTVVDAQVLKPMLGDTASEDWQEGQWSDRRGWPSGTALANGRLWWSGDDALWGSISDAYSSFDEEFDGDAGPISRAIALGGRNESRWMLALSQLLIGCDSRVAAVRASSLDEVITAGNFDIKNVDKVPAASVAPVELRNDRGLFVADNNTSIYELSQSGDGSGKFIASRFSLLCEDVYSTGIAQMCVQNFPDQRVWVATDSSDAAMTLYEPLLDIQAVIPIVLSDGDVIEGVIAVPGALQDRLYAICKRTVNGSTVRYWEKLALDSEAIPQDVCKICDSFISETGAHSATITGLDHLEGRTVVAWADGAPVGSVSNGNEVFAVVDDGIISGTNSENTTYTQGYANYDGEATAVRMLEDAVTGSHALADTWTIPAGTYRMTVIAKSIGGRYINPTIYSSDFSQGVSKVFNLTAGSVGSAGFEIGSLSLIGSSIEDLGDSWYACHMDFNTSALLTAANAYAFMQTGNTIGTYLGEVDKGVYIGGVYLYEAAYDGTAQDFIVTGGSITLPLAVNDGYCVGLKYTGRYKSARLAYGAEGTSPFLKGKVLARAGLLLGDYARNGIKIGGTGEFDDPDHPLRNLPEIDSATGTTADVVVSGAGNDEDGFPVEADFKTDPRFCLEVESPYPCTLRALILTPDF